jgi:GAF domain-containing protein
MKTQEIPSEALVFRHQVFVSTLREQGVRAALRYLNSCSRHRFTALYRFDGSTLRNLYLIDKHDPSVERCPDLPVLETYCVYIRDQAKPFLVRDAHEDERVEGHPKQKLVRAYCGTPLFDREGRMFGTLCHFDLEPVSSDDDEASSLHQVASLLIDSVTAELAQPQKSQP